MKNLLFVSLVLLSHLPYGQGNVFPSSGNAVIGTISPATKLQVIFFNSSVNRKFSIENSGPALFREGGASGLADYVFKPLYDLRPLSDVEVFITKNRHLPNVLPENEASGNWVNLMEMSVKLLGSWRIEEGNRSAKEIIKDILEANES